MRTDEHATASGWAWRWIGWASWPISPAVLWVCAAAVVVDVGTSWWGEPEWYLGRVSLSPALPLGVAPGRADRSPPPRLLAPEPARLARVPAARRRRSSLVWCISYPQSVAAWRDVEGIVVAVAGEELVYRLAAVILVGALCARFAGRNWRDTAAWGDGPAIGGLIGAGLVFSVLPGPRRPDDRRDERRAVPEPRGAARLRGAALRVAPPRLPRAPRHRPRRARVLRRRAARRPARARSTWVRWSASCSGSCSPGAASASAAGSRGSSTCAAPTARPRPSRPEPRRRATARPPGDAARLRTDTTPGAGIPSGRRAPTQRSPGIADAHLDDALRDECRSRRHDRPSSSSCTTQRYVDALEEFARDGGGQLDPDTVVAPTSFAAAVRAAGCGLAAIDALDAGEADARVRRRPSARPPRDPRPRPGLLPVQQRRDRGGRARRAR